MSMVMILSLRGRQLKNKNSKKRDAVQIVSPLLIWN